MRVVMVSHARARNASTCVLRTYVRSDRASRRRRRCAALLRRVLQKLILYA